MSRDLADLDPQFRAVVDRLLADLDERQGVHMVPYCTLRTPQEQAELWRQGRPTWLIERRIKNLRRNGADFLADCIERAGPQRGNRVTGAIPGLSWHQWGLAVDCYRDVSGGADWSLSAYEPYAKAAEAAGLTAGFGWRTPDAPHIQAPEEDSPEARYTITEINDMMRERFG